MCVSRSLGLALASVIVRSRVFSNLCVNGSVCNGSLGGKHETNMRSHQSLVLCTTLVLAAVAAISAPPTTTPPPTPPPPTPPPPLASFIATQHFQPCYNASTLPSLLDGAVQAARLGSKSFKFALKDHMGNMYPLNNHHAQWPAAPATLTDVLAAPQVQSLLRNELHTGFESITLWAYRVGAPDAPFCDESALPIPAAELAAQRQQMANLTTALMALPTGAGTPSSYWLEAWENDWATRCGSYAQEHPPGAAVRAAYAAWLTARQLGVEEGRRAYCETMGGVLGGSTVDCADSAAVAHVAHVKVYHGAEVNLVGACLNNASCGNIVTEVLPHVPLDYVSYSAYDTMRTTQLADALDLIAAKHNRTAAAPERALFITEFGLPETTTDAAITRHVVDNVLRIGRAKDLARVHYWQTINNEKLHGGTCSAGMPPLLDPAVQNGFWTTLPNGTLSDVGQYLSDVIAGRQPMPS